MKSTKAKLAIGGASVLALVLAGSASAQLSGAICQAGDPTDQTTNPAKHGTATLSPNLGTSPGTSAFHFEANLSCQGSYSSAKVCSYGTASNATCAENVTAGHFIVCSGDCTDTFTSAACATGSTKLSEGDFNGLCVGPNCSGGGSNVVYSLVFTPTTIQNAMANCSPTGGPGVGTAQFDGVIGYK